MILLKNKKIGKKHLTIEQRQSETSETVKEQENR